MLMLGSNNDLKKMGVSTKMNIKFTMSVEVLKIHLILLKGTTSRFCKFVLVPGSEILSSFIKLHIVLIFI